MGKTFASAAALVLFLASCTLEYPATATDLGSAGRWKFRLDRDMAVGSTPENVASYLRTNGAVEISLSEDRRTLRAAQSTKVKRLWPPIDSNSVQIECSFNPGSGLDSCSVLLSSRSCCGR